MTNIPRLVFALVFSLSAQHPPESPISGTIRVWGSNEMAGVLHNWEQGFRSHQPQVQFEDHLYGTASSIAGLYTGVADISLLGRDIWPIEKTAFESVFHHQPTGIQIATGSYDIPKAAYALVVYVNKANPLSQMTLDDLAAVFGVPNDEKARVIRNWGDLGLTGSWSSAPIHLYNFDYENDKSRFFRNRVFADRYRWRDTIREFTNRVNADGSTTDSGQLILDVLATDSSGIAVSNPHYANSHVKPVALSTNERDYVSAGKATVMDRTYPLSRPVWIYINRPPGAPLDPKLAEFLRYVLSREGQDDVVRDGTYLPLPAKIATEELTGIS